MQEELELIREQAQKIERSGALGPIALVCAAARVPRRLLDEGTDAERARDRDGGVRQGRRLRSEPRLDGSRLRAQPAAEARSLLRDGRRAGAASARARARRIPRVAREVGRRGGAVEPRPRRRRRRPRPPPVLVERRAPRGRLAVAAVVLLALGAAIGFARRQCARARAHGRRKPSRPSPIWASLLDDDMPVLVVVGDYYIFGELDAHGDVERLVRDFTVTRARSSTSWSCTTPTCSAGTWTSTSRICRAPARSRCSTCCECCTPRASPCASCRCRSSTSRT